MTDIKSQDDLNAQGRETDVLIATLTKCQDIVRKNVELENENKRIKELLKECKNIVAHDCWQEAQFPDGQVVQRQDLLTRINIAIGESED